jgi:hypothetical protein
MGKVKMLAVSPAVHAKLKNEARKRGMKVHKLTEKLISESAIFLPKTSIEGKSNA